MSKILEKVEYDGSMVGRLDGQDAQRVESLGLLHTPGAAGVPLMALARAVGDVERWALDRPQAQSNQPLRMYKFETAVAALLVSHGRLEAENAELKRKPAEPPAPVVEPKSATWRGLIFDSNGANQLISLARTAGVELLPEKQHAGYALMVIRQALEELQKKLAAAAKPAAPAEVPAWNAIPGRPSVVHPGDGPLLGISRAAADNVKSILGVLEVDMNQHGRESTLEALQKVIALVAENGGPDVDG